MTATVDSRTKSSLDDLLKCSICYDHLQDPRTLPCLHTFCTPCLQGLYNATIHNDLSLLSYDVISCPTCRTRTIVPQNGIHGFPNDFKISKISEIMTTCNMANEDNGVIRRCDICKFTNRHIQASTFCVECSRYFCCGCLTRHDSRTLLKGHQRFELTKAKFIDVKCKIHDREIVQYFCNECKESICIHCTIAGLHSSHDIIELGSGVQQCEGNLKESAEGLSNKLQKVTVLLYKMNDIETQMRTIFDESTELVKIRVREIVMSIKKREHQLLNHLEEHYQANLLEFKSNVESLECFQKLLSDSRDEVTQALYEDDDAKILEASKVLCPKVKLALEKYKNNEFDGQVHLSKFIPSKKIVKLGKIQQYSVTADKIVEETPNAFQHVPVAMLEYPRLLFVSKFSTSSAWIGEVSYPNMVAILPNGSLVVGDTENSSIQIFDIEGNYIKTVTEGIIKPLSLSVTLNGDVAIADMIDRKVKVIDLEGNIKKEFGQFCSPSGLTVNKKGDIIVTDFYQNSLEIFGPNYQRKHKTSLHNYKGISRDGCCQPVADSKGKIYVADIGDGAISQFDEEGKFLKKFHVGNEHNTLKGIAVDRRDRILYCNESNASVCILDPETNQEHTLLDQKSGLRAPSGLQISEQRFLVMTEGKADCIRVYQLCDVDWQNNLPVLSENEEK